MLTEIEFAGNEAVRSHELVDRALDGEVFLIRNALQQFDLMRGLVEASLEGVRRIAGDEAARRTEAEGSNHIHKWIPPEDIPALTEAVYATVRPLAPSFLRKFVQEAFPDAATLYYEQSPTSVFIFPMTLLPRTNPLSRPLANRMVRARSPRMDHTGIPGSIVRQMASTSGSQLVPCAKAMD